MSPEKLAEAPPAIGDVDLDFVMTRINKLEMDNVVLRRELANAQDTLRREKDAMEVLIEAAQRLRVQNEELQRDPSRDTVAFLEEQLSEKDDLIRVMLEAKGGTASTDPEEATFERERELLIQVEATGELLESSKRRESDLKEQLRAQQDALASTASGKTHDINEEAFKRREGQLSSQVDQLQAELQAARRDSESQREEVTKLSNMLSSAHELGSARAAAAATSAESEVTLLQAQASARDTEIERLQGIAEEQDEMIQGLLDTSGSAEHVAGVEASEKRLQAELGKQQKEYSEMDLMWQKRLEDNEAEIREMRKREAIMEVPKYMPRRDPTLPFHIHISSYIYIYMYLRRYIFSLSFMMCTRVQSELLHTLEIAEGNKHRFETEVSRLSETLEGAREEWEREWQEAFYLWKPGLISGIVSREAADASCIPFNLNLQQGLIHIEEAIATRDEELSFLTEALRSTSIEREELPPLLPTWRGLVQLVDRCRLDVKGFQGRLAEKCKECELLQTEVFRMVVAAERAGQDESFQLKQDAPKVDIESAGTRGPPGEQVQRRRAGAPGSAPRPPGPAGLLRIV